MAMAAVLLHLQLKQFHQRKHKEYNPKVDLNIIKVIATALEEYISIKEAGQ